MYCTDVGDMEIAGWVSPRGRRRNRGPWSARDVFGVLGSRTIRTST